jgi:hypothetical protein
MRTDEGSVSISRPLFEHPQHLLQVLGREAMRHPDTSTVREHNLDLLTTLLPAILRFHQPHSMKAQPVPLRLLYPRCPPTYPFSP